MHPKLLKEVLHCLLLLCDDKKAEAKQAAETLLKTIEDHAKEHEGHPHHVGRPQKPHTTKG